MIATAPPADFAHVIYVKSLGADACFEFASPSVVEDIKTKAEAVHSSGVTHGLDCFSQHSASYQVAFPIL